MSRVPIMFLSDAVTAPTGLARITRELAIRTHENMPEFRVATFGAGGSTSRHIPYPHYPATISNQYVLPELLRNWKDFAGEEKGVLFCIQNAPWCWWLADPSKLPDGNLKAFLQGDPFKKWIYVPIDGDGPNRTIPSIKDVLIKFDRVLAYTQYGAGVIDRTLGVTGTPNLPHGLDTSIFYPRERVEARRAFVERVLGKKASPISDKIVLVGCVATNSPRKDWYLALEVCGELLERGVNVGLWAHTDGVKRHWDIPALADEFGMTKRIIFSDRMMSDDDMAWAYSACDCVLCIGSGEGWGLSGSEALGCHIPVVHGNYAGGAEFTPKSMLVEPIGFRGDGYYGIRRPVFDASCWADAVQAALRGGYGRESILPSYINWNNCWPEWQKWLKEGIE